MSKNFDFLEVVPTAKTKFYDEARNVFMAIFWLRPRHKYALIDTVESPKFIREFENDLDKKIRLRYPF